MINKRPYTFSKYGHYLVISDVDKNKNFYVLNPNKIGDTQIIVPYDYETIISLKKGKNKCLGLFFFYIEGKIN